MGGFAIIEKLPEIIATTGCSLLELIYFLDRHHYDSRPTVPIMSSLLLLSATSTLRATATTLTRTTSRFRPGFLLLSDSFSSRTSRPTFPRRRAPMASASFIDVSSQPLYAPKGLKPTTPGASKPAPIPAVDGDEDPAEAFRKLGLTGEVLEAVQSFGFNEPSGIQKLAIPQVLKGDDLAFAAATGSGKTLSYLLPIIQQLKWQEQGNRERKNMRPRVLILVPTRELVSQVGENPTCLIPANGWIIAYGAHIYWYIWIGAGGDQEAEPCGQGVLVWFAWRRRLWVTTEAIGGCGGYRGGFPITPTPAL